jgi:hypothetical protein
MNPHHTNNRLVALAKELSELRDTWMRISMIFKDHIADTPSLERDEVLAQVESQLARIRVSEPKNPQ